jgi:hypothetical protein
LRTVDVLDLCLDLRELFKILTFQQRQSQGLAAIERRGAVFTRACARAFTA